MLMGGQVQTSGSDGFECDVVSSACYVLICGNKLELECLAIALKSRNAGVSILEFESVDEFSEAATVRNHMNAILVYIDSLLDSQTPVDAVLEELLAAAQDVPIVVLGKSEKLHEVKAVLDKGVRGYIPADVGVDAIMDATRLAALVGGAFLTTEHFASLDLNDVNLNIDLRGIQLTQRQMEVARELRVGKANKLIAYDLNMQENTVKVHVRTIMRKLRATNRTQAAVALNQYFSG